MFSDVTKEGVEPFHPDLEHEFKLDFELAFGLRYYGGFVRMIHSNHDLLRNICSNSESDTVLPLSIHCTII